MDAFIKLQRKMLDWEWYTDNNTKVVFLHCLLKANWKDGRFRGYKVPRGSFVSGRKVLAEELGLSDRQVRTALLHLKATNEVTIKSTSKFSIITVVNYDKYQTTDQQNDQQVTSKRPASDQQATTIEEYKEYKKRKNNKKWTDDPEVNAAINDFIDHRKKIKSPMTDKAIKLFIGRLNSLASTPRAKVDLINTAIERGWKSVYPAKEGHPMERNNQSKFDELERRAMKEE